MIQNCKAVRVDCGVYASLSDEWISCDYGVRNESSDFVTLEVVGDNGEDIGVATYAFDRVARLLIFDSETYMETVGVSFEVSEMDLLNQYVKGELDRVSYYEIYDLENNGLKAFAVVIKDKTIVIEAKKSPLVSFKRSG